MNMRKRIVKHIQEVLKEFNDGDITNVSEICSKMNKVPRCTRYSTSEVAGNMPKVAHCFIPLGYKDEYGLNAYQVHKQE